MDNLARFKIHSLNEITLDEENLGYLRRMNVPGGTCVIKFKNPEEMIERQIFVGAMQVITCVNEFFYALVMKIEQIDDGYEMTLLNARTKLKVEF
jgi:hypothetical protein